MKRSSVDQHFVISVRDSHFSSEKKMDESVIFCYKYHPYVPTLMQNVSLNVPLFLESRFSIIFVLYVTNDTME